MRQPRRAGAPVDSGRIKEWLETFDGYRVAVTDQRIQDWLRQFGDHHADLGARVLDATLFFKPQDIEDGMREVIGFASGRG